MTEQIPYNCRQCPRVRSAEEAERCAASPAHKTVVRRAVMNALGTMSPEVRRQKSLAIVRRVLASEAFRSARMIMGYVAMELEVDLWTLVQESWKAGKRVAMPRIIPPLDEPRIPFVHDRRILPYEIVAAEVDEAIDHPGLQMDILGIWEPKPTSRPVGLAEVDLVLVPCLAYDRCGRRMGKGGGFYDRLLVSDGLRAVAAGVAFSEQVFGALPCCPHDRPVDMLFTETGVVEFCGRGAGARGAK